MHGLSSALSKFQNFKFTAKSNISTKLMAKLKLSTIIHSLQLCRPKHHSTFPENPVPANYGLSPANLPPPPPSTPVQILRSPCHVSSSSKTVSAGCGCRSGSCAQFLFSSDREIGARSPEQVGSRSRVKSGSSSDRSLKINRTKKKTVKELRSDAMSGISSSEWFGDEEDSQEIRTLVSSFFSTDSSPELSSTTTRSEKWSTKRDDSKNWSSRNYRSPESEASGEFVGAIEAAEGEKLKESFAVAKKSEDPYRDFKRSMTEMIVEKEMFEAEELEQLLRCFLSLNSRSYHRVIVEAFSEIWEVLFCDMNLPLSLAN